MCSRMMLRECVAIPYWLLDLARLESKTPSAGIENPFGSNRKPLRLVQKRKGSKNVDGAVQKRSGGLAESNRRPLPP